MGIMDFIRSELIDIIEWLQDTDDSTLVYRFPRHDNEIKNGAKLTVREGQAAVFINEGKIADIFGPGMYTLNTQNLPLLSTLKGWKYGFDSPFKAEVYFMNMRLVSFKWGTPNPVMLRDPDFGMVRIRAFGSYEIQISDPAKFLQNIVGTDNEFTTDEVSEKLRNIVIPKFTDAIGESKIPVLDFAASYNELSEFITKNIASDYENDYGLLLKRFLITNISLPPAVEEAIDKRSSMGAIGDMNKYSQMQSADAMHAAAQNPGGGGGGMENMMGMAMMQQMMNQQQMVSQQQQPQYQQQQYQQPAPPPMPQQSSYFVSVGGQQQGPFDMNALRQMVSQNQFSKESYVWKQGMQGWQQAGQVSELASLFGAPNNAPPPPPPPPM